MQEQLLAQAARQLAPSVAPKATQVIFLFMAGAPSQLDLFDDKPALRKYDGQDVPAEIVKGERFAFIKGTPKLLGSPFDFRRHGQSGQEISDLLPHLTTIADDIAIVKSMQTTQFNHAPAQIFMNTGHQVIGRPSMGSWLSYGLGIREQGPPRVRRADLRREQPRRRQVVLGLAASCPPSTRASSSAAAPIRCCSSPIPTASTRRCDARSLDALKDLNGLRQPIVGDPEIETRINAYELAYRMQTSVPELTDISGEPQSVHELYGTQPGRPRSPTTACWRVDWSSAACASCSSTTAAGTPTAPASARTSSRSCLTCAARPTSRPRRS